MGRQRNKPQSKGKKESPEKELNEIEARHRVQNKGYKDAQGTQ